ncbi:MAG: glycosyltransferase [Candidatus Saccharibacteria bacterium]|nr:glycosyltransferase [Candidatus Saccharibacteria bacterium]
MINDLLKQKIQTLERENDILRRENKYLHKLTSSRRFVFAEKIATGFNGVFPKNTKRRNLVEKVGRGAFWVASTGARKKRNKTAKKISSMAGKYEKVIVLNSIPWDVKLKQRPHHLAREFSKIGYFVVYLEYDNPLQVFRIISDNLVIVNTDLFIRNLPNVCKKCYFLTPNNMPTKYDTLKRIKEGGFEIIYDYLDEFHEDISGDLSIQMEVWDKLSTLKPILCTVTAKRLYDELKKHLGVKQKVAMARNAVDIDHFNFEKNKTNTPPNDLKEVVKKKKPIIGFYGALAPWIDFDLLNKVAINHKEWEFVYLGVDYNGAAVDLVKGDNVHNLGAKNYESLPKYAKYFDCAIIPFKRGEIAKATSPVKLFEYMAAGLPTVCTRDLQECKGYDLVYMSKDDKEFEKNLKIAINDIKNTENRKKLLAQAEDNTWAKRVEIISENLK